MSNGVRLYNEKQQIMVDNNYTNFAFSQKYTVNTGDFVLYNDVPEFSFTGDTPVLVYELGDENKRLAITRVSHQENGEYAVSFVQCPADNIKKDISFFIFDRAKNGILQGQSGLRIYNQNSGEIVFDSRLRHLQILGEIYHRMPIDPNKKYGVLLRSKLKFIRSSDVTRQRRGWSEIEKWISDVAFIKDNKVHLEPVVLKRLDNFFYYSTGNPTDSGRIEYPMLAPPLLVDLSLMD